MSPWSLEWDFLNLHIIFPEIDLEGNIHTMEIKEFAPLYLGKCPCEPGTKYSGDAISFGDTTSGKVIPFVKWKELWVATRCVCTRISWKDLDKAGFIFGRPVKIDGAPYLFRSLKVGTKRGAPNEWDAILDNLGEDDSLWHWDDIFFWGQETSNNYTSLRAARGYSSARHWNIIAAATRNVSVGFRPVLEPLPSGPLIADSLVGADLKIYGPSGDVVGQLIDFSDYDLVVRPKGNQTLPLDYGWARVIDHNVVIDRAAITWMKKEG